MKKLLCVITCVLFSACGASGDDDDIPVGADASIDVPPDATPLPPPPDARPPRPDATPKHGFRESCNSASECESNVCLNGPEGQAPLCAAGPCTVVVANDCQDLDSLCIPLTSGDFVCTPFQTLDTGIDSDDAVLSPGDSVTRGMGSLTDADVFVVPTPIGTTTVSVTTENPSLDVRIDLFDDIARPIFSANSGGPGESEGVIIGPTTVNSYKFLVVTNMGGATGPYTVSVTHQL